MCPVLEIYQNHSCPPLTWISCQEIAIGKMIPTHPNLPVFVGWVATQSRAPMVMWKLINGHNLHEVFAMHRMRCKEKHAWRPKEEYVLSWSRQLFSALACLHYHGATCTISPIFSQSHGVTGSDRMNCSNRRKCANWLVILPHVLCRVSMSAYVSIRQKID